MDILCKLLPQYDCSSLQVNFLTSIIFLIPSIIISVFLIPKITVWLINRKNRKFQYQRVAFVISELCRFFDTNKFPIYKDKLTNRITLNSKPEEIKFLGLIPKQILAKEGRAEIELAIMNLSQTIKPNELVELLKEENKRIKSLESSLENILSVHSSNFSDDAISRISTLCFNIKNYRHYFANNKTSTNLGIKRETVFGLIDLVDLYKETMQMLIHFTTKYKSKLLVE